MKVISIERPYAVAEVGGVRRQISVDLLPEVEVGDYVVVHAGFAIERLQEDEALETLELIRQMEEKALEDEISR